ncbi:MAG: gamma-glutamylcyclotransferase [Rhodospirillales bacterium]|nr:gamma-glutamylcyclotransferase [Rhodospirillales bacterium]
MTDAKAKDVWVFGYGSLLWNTGFAYADVTPARVQGYHRALCVYSHVYRGSKERPGLVCGLLPGGSCRGLAFRVAGGDWDNVRDYLHEREMIYDVYVPKWVNARLGPKLTEIDKVYTFVANARHDQYAGRLSVEETANLIRHGHGMSGSGLDYLTNTVTRLAELGIRDRALERVLAKARDEIRATN